eukprot:CFRG3503T1
MESVAAYLNTTINHHYGSVMWGFSDTIENNNIDIEINRIVQTKPWHIGVLQHHIHQKFGPNGTLPYDNDLIVEAGLREMRRSAVVIVGLVRNFGSDEKNKNMTTRVEELGLMFGDYKIITVENDSDDGTPTLLRAWGRRNSRVQVIASEFKFDNKFGKNVDHVRFKRMALVRNLYMLELATNRLYQDADYMLVIDMDNKNGWSRDGIAHSFGLPGFHIPRTTTNNQSKNISDEVRDSGFPLYWDMVCSNGRVQSQRGLQYTHTPVGGLPVWALTQGLTRAKRMEAATRRMRVFPDLLDDLIKLTPDGTFNYVEKAYNLSSKVKHYGFSLDTEELGDLKGTPVATFVEYLRNAIQDSTKKNMRASLANLTLGNGYASMLNNNRTGVDVVGAGAVVTVNMGVNVEKSNNFRNNMDVSIHSIHSSTTLHHKQALALAQDLMQYIPSYGKPEAYSLAISTLYMQCVRAQVAAAYVKGVNYLAIQGRFYDSLAFRDDVFNDVNFRTHQFVSHTPHVDYPYYVASCFGGLAVYRRESIRACQYDTQTRECEHHTLHKCMARQGRSRFLFNPTMVVEY